MAGLNSDLPEQGLTFQPGELQQSLDSLNPEKHVWEMQIDSDLNRDLSLFTYQGLLVDEPPLKLQDLMRGETAAGK